MLFNSEPVDSPTGEEAIEDEPVDTPEGDDTAEPGTEEYTPREKQLYARAKKAEAELKAAKAAKTEPNSTTDFGYDVKAYLKASGIQADEFDFVKAELKASGLNDIDALLGNDYFKSKLERRRELARTEEATPSGKRSGGAATGSVDYWLSKSFEEVPKDMRPKVLNARIEREKKGGVFYNS